MTVKTLVRTSINGRIYPAGVEIKNIDKAQAKKLESYGIVEIIPTPRSRKKVETQDKFKADIEVK